MKINKTICIDQDLIYSEKIHELIKSQKFSGLINDLLRTHLNINTSKVSEDLAKEELEQRLKEISVRKTELQKHPNVEVLENIYPFDFMKNRSVPSCFLLSENEKNAVIKFLETPIHKFPKIDSTDPVAERFGAKIGDMIYIKRYGGSELTYRVVIKPGSG